MNTADLQNLVGTDTVVVIESEGTTLYGTVLATNVEYITQSDTVSDRGVRVKVTDEEGNPAVLRNKWGRPADEGTFAPRQITETMDDLLARLEQQKVERAEREARVAEERKADAEARRPLLAELHSLVGRYVADIDSHAYEVDDLRQLLDSIRNARVEIVQPGIYDVTVMVPRFREVREESFTFVAMGDTLVDLDKGRDREGHFGRPTFESTVARAALVSRIG